MASFSSTEGSATGDQPKIEGPHFGNKRGSALPFIVGGVVGGAGLLASAWGTNVFAIFLVIVAAASGADLATAARKNYSTVSIAPLLVSIAASGLVPLSAFVWGESSLGLVMALILVGLGVLLVLRGQTAGTLDAVGFVIFSSIYIGALSSFLVLIRVATGGHMRLLSFALMAGAYNLAASVVGARFGRGDGEEDAMQAVAARRRWSGAAGVGAATIAALLPALFLDPPAGPGLLIPLGVIVGLGCYLGSATGRMIRSQIGVGELEASVPGRGGLVFRLETLLMSAPAFFYGFRLYLT